MPTGRTEASIKPRRKVVTEKADQCLFPEGNAQRIACVGETLYSAFTREAGTVNGGITVGTAISIALLCRVL